MSTPTRAGDFDSNKPATELNFSASMATLRAMLTIYIKGWQQV
jgi:hypothetical protein